MDSYTLSSTIITLAVLMGYINHKYIHMQSTIAIMTGSLLLSAILLILQYFGIADIAHFFQIKIIDHIHFPNLLLKGMLSFLLFAGALTIDFNTLRNQKWEIGILASLSTIASTFLVATLLYYLLPLLSLQLPYLYCLLFGALISPTDPIAVLATFKKINAPKQLSVCVSGEALFNDGVGIVLFTTLYALAFQGESLHLQNVLALFFKEALGGIGYGLILGFLVSRLIRSTNDQHMMILITLAVVTGGYSLALSLGISGPLAMVVTGIIIGNDPTLTRKKIGARNTLSIFWEVIDEVLNAILFLLIGFELLTIKATGLQALAAFITIPLVLIIRLCTVSIPMKLIQKRKAQSSYLIPILTWGGLRGGLAVALALSLPTSHYRDFILTMTYAVVAFSVIVQGMSIKPLADLAKQSINK